MGDIGPIRRRIIVEPVEEPAEPVPQEPAPSTPEQEKEPVPG